MGSMDPRDLGALSEIVSYEYVSESTAKETAKEFLQRNTLLSDKQRLFVDAFYHSDNTLG